MHAVTGGGSGRICHLDTVIVLNVRTVNVIPCPITYRDATMAIYGIERSEALKYKQEYDQAHMVVLKGNDSPEFI